MITFRITQQGCFHCGQTHLGALQGGDLPAHTREDGTVCPGSGLQSDPHDYIDARRTKTCGACGSSNYDCGDNYCCDHCRFAERHKRLEMVKSDPTSKAVSAQYAQPCPVCAAGPFAPCRTRKTGRVTDTHLARLDGPKMAYIPANDMAYVPLDMPFSEGHWKAVEPCGDDCESLNHSVHPAPMQHLLAVEVIKAEGVHVSLIPDGSACAHLRDMVTAQ